MERTYESTMTRIAWWDCDVYDAQALRHKSSVQHVYLTDCSLVLHGCKTQCRLHASAQHSTVCSKRHPVLTSLRAIVNHCSEALIAPLCSAGIACCMQVYSVQEVLWVPIALCQVCVQCQGILTLSSHLAGNMYEVPKQLLMSVSALRQLG